MKKQTRGNLILLLTAFIWGVAFVSQSAGMEYIGPFTFNTIRNILSALTLLICMPLIKKINKQPLTNDNHKCVTGGIICGVILGIAMCLQQYGIQYTTVGKAGFITALYIILVPLFSIFLKKMPQLKIWIGVILALIGLYLLTMNERLTIAPGDLYLLGCAIVFAIHITVIDYYSPHVDGVKMSCIQFFVASIVCLIPTLLFEQINFNSILSCAIPLLYAGVLSGGAGYTLQIIAQKDTDPTIASLIMSLESVFSVLAGWVLLHQVLSTKELLGCVLVFAAIIITQLPGKNNIKNDTV